LQNGKTLQILGGSPDKKYIKSIELDGNTWNNTWIPLDKLENGGTLKFELSEEPNKEWGTAKIPPSFDVK
jgi:putative alpha-1,2-mannosidase